MEHEWINATVTPERDGSYEVRLISPDKFEPEETIMPAEWRDGQWLLYTLTGPYDGDSTFDFSWREKRVGRAC